MKKVLLVCIYFFAAVGVFFTLAFFAIKLHLTNVSGTNDRILHAPETNEKITQVSSSQAWIKTREWKTLKVAITADASTINKAAIATHIPARLIVAQLVVEQLRLFTSNREIYKQVFEPLKILGAESVFLGHYGH
jgi:hypothetical protein